MKICGKEYRWRKSRDKMRPIMHAAFKGFSSGFCGRQIAFPWNEEDDMNYAGFECKNCIKIIKKESKP